MIQYLFTLMSSQKRQKIMIDIGTNGMKLNRPGIDLDPEHANSK